MGGGALHKPAGRLLPLLLAAGLAGAGLAQAPARLPVRTRPILLPPAPLPRGGGAGGAPQAPSSPSGADFGFLATTDTGVYPADPKLAAGPANIVTIVNGEIAFFDKDGVNTFRQDIRGSGGFWGPVGAENVFDPGALFDRHSNRFVVCAADAGSNGGQFLDLAVSDDSDPNGVWFKYRIDVTSSGDFLDFPNLGVDEQAIYISNDFFSAPTGNFIHILPKAPLLAGGPATVNSVRTAGSPISLGAVKTLDTGAAAQYFITAFSGSSTRLLLKAIQNPLGTPVLTEFQLPVPNYNWPPDADQFGSSNLVDTIDFRIKNGVFRDGHLWAAHTVGVNGTARVRWYEIDPRGWPASGSNPVLLQSGTLNLGVGEHTFDPDIKVDAAGDMALAFNRSSAGQYISVERAFRLAGDAPGTLRAPVLLKVSQAPEEGSRWGDYGGLEEDPADPGTFWNHHLFRSQRRWRTWVGRFRAAPGPEVNNIILSGPGTAQVSDMVTFQWRKAPPGKTWLLLFSKKLGGSTIDGHPFDVGPGVRTLGTGTNSPAGMGSWTGGPVPARFQGRTFYFEVRSDFGATIYDSNAVSLTVN